MPGRSGRAVAGRFAERWEAVPATLVLLGGRAGNTVAVGRPCRRLVMPGGCAGGSHCARVCCNPCRAPSSSRTTWQEYPAAHAESFPVHLGFCQSGSSLDFDEEGMRWRNIVWWVAARGWGGEERWSKPCASPLCAEDAGAADSVPAPSTLPPTPHPRPGSTADWRRWIWRPRCCSRC